MRSLVLAVLLAGCATAPRHPMVKWDPIPSAPSPTGWWKFATPDFVLITDLDADDGRDAVDAIALEFAVMRSMLGSAVPTHKRPVQIFVLADGLEYEEYFGRLAAGVVTHDDDGTNVFLYGKASKWERQASMVEGAPSLISHELAHVVLNQYFAQQPRWFAEGLAQFLEAYRWSDDGKRVEFGLANLSAYQIYRKNRALGANDVLSWGNASAGEGEGKSRSLYGFSWALVHYLINVDPQRFAAILEALAANRDATTFVLDPDLDTKVHGYMKTGDYSTFEIDVVRGNVPAQQLAVTNEDLAKARIELKLTGKGFKR